MSLYGNPDKVQNSKIGNTKQESENDISTIEEELKDNTGNTGERPTMTTVSSQTYFDTTLGIPVWYNGTEWVDASGIAK